ncbi:MAG: prohibitin family protein [Clostridia bacterium]|nr:prohibitin family protein [Clostridia bacterium]MBQ6358093.1 prohibitin family protein [Clostridia bacterium]MBQ7754735.1 prohibitin family protein [Clostridia bacterium]MBR0422491.1 prohibitin family protein [Clostridia bacterium]
MFKDKAGNFSPFKLVGLILVVILLVVFVSASYVVIPAGHTGVALTFGKVEDTVLQEGLHFKVPFVQKIAVMDNRIVKLDVNTEAFSKDLQTITTVVAVNYHVGKENSQTVYKNVGLNFEEVLITPAVNEVLKAVTAKYTAVELVSSRAEVSMLLDDGLNEKLNGYGIFINELNIINWDFSEEYINAVEAKQVAEQNLIKTRTEQEQALVIANTEAQKRVIAAEAEANEIKVLAEANAESNRILTESITDLLIRYQTVAKWDGKLPTVMSGGDNMLIDIPLTSEQPGE